MCMNLVLTMQTGHPTGQYMVLEEPSGFLGHEQCLAHDMIPSTSLLASLTLVSLNTLLMSSDQSQETVSLSKFLNGWICHKRQ